VHVTVRDIDVMCVVKNTSPEPEPGIENESALQAALQLWTCVTSGTLDLSQSQLTDFTLEMMNITPFGLFHRVCSLMLYKDLQ